MTTEVVLVGGGLANCLIAFRLLSVRPQTRLLLLEREPALGGRHTWSFHEDDLTPEQHRWLRPLVAHSWSRHEVRFPAYARTIERSYHSITSERLACVVAKELGDRVRLNASVAAVRPDGVDLDDGTQVSATAVIDGRGDPQGQHPVGRHLDLGFQKFLGQTLELDAEHGLHGPILMDATVAQRDGFRFLYTLPFGDRRLLVEDTRYSDSGTFDRDELRAEIDAYARAQGWRVRRVVEEETGSLPIVLDGDIDGFWAADPGLPRAGLRAALFHPTTGYSLPQAVRLADGIATSTELTSPALYRLTRAASLDAWRHGGYFRLLNRLMYRASVPDKRYRVLEHFYRLSLPLIGRFYGGRLTRRDKFRILSGRPPVPILGAARVLLSPGWRSAAAQPTGKDQTS